MKKTIAKWAAGIFILLLILSSIGLNILVYFNGYKLKIMQEGANIALTQIVTATQDGKEFKFNTDKGEITLIQKE